MMQIRPPHRWTPPSSCGDLQVVKLDRCSHDWEVLATNNIPCADFPSFVDQTDSDESGRRGVVVGLKQVGEGLCLGSRV